MCSSRLKIPKRVIQPLEAPPLSILQQDCTLLTFCPSNVNSLPPRPIAPHTLSSSCPSFLATVEVTFINGEFMCMTAPKPELCLHHPWRLSVNSCNHQSNNQLPFRTHQLCMRWLPVIYGIWSISHSADLRWYWYGVISSWLHFSDRNTCPVILSKWFNVLHNFHSKLVGLFVDALMLFRFNLCNSGCRMC